MAMTVKQMIEVTMNDLIYTLMEEEGVSYDEAKRMLGEAMNPNDPRSREVRYAEFEYERGGF